MFGKIAAVGIEIEGPWTDFISPDDRTVMDFHQEWLWMNKPEYEGALLKELVSHPLRTRPKVDEFFGIADSYLIDKAICHGMGLHVHMSFREPRYYNIVFSKKFVEEFKKRLLKDFADDEFFMERLDWRSPEYGTNFYKMDYPDSYFQRGTTGHENQERYYAVNICRAYAAHKTVEFRVFPTAKVSRMKEYLDWLINFVNEYLEAHIDELRYEKKLEYKQTLKTKKKEIKWTPKVNPRRKQYFRKTTKENDAYILNGYKVPFELEGLNPAESYQVDMEGKLRTYNRKTKHLAYYMYDFETGKHKVQLQ